MVFHGTVQNVEWCCRECSFSEMHSAQSCHSCSAKANGRGLPEQDSCWGSSCHWGPSASCSPLVKQNLKATGPEATKGIHLMPFPPLSQNCNMQASQGQKRSLIHIYSAQAGFMEVRDWKYSHWFSWCAQWISLSLLHARKWKMMWHRTN